VFCMTNFSRTVNQHVNAAAIALQIRNESVNVFVAGQVGAARACPQRMLLRGLDQIFQERRASCQPDILERLLLRGLWQSLSRYQSLHPLRRLPVAQILHGSSPFLIGWLSVVMTLLTVSPKRK